jgi:ABC-type polysaccharide/polyol phosphate transport system ATPase subunit
MRKVEFLCDCVVWIDEHRVRESGPAADVVAEYQKLLKQKLGAVMREKR